VDATGTGNGTFLITVPFVVIDGFTIRGGTAGSFPAGVALINSSPTSGLQVVNNIIENNSVGVLLGAGVGDVVERNLFQENNAGLGSSGYGLYAQGGTAEGINDNSFSGNHAVAISATGETFVTITNNTSEDDGSFAAFFATTGGLFKHNKGRNFGAKGVSPVYVVGLTVLTADADAAVDISWGNQALEISDNDLEEGEGSLSNGVAFTTAWGSSYETLMDSEGVVVKNNRIKGFKCNGIVAEAALGQGMTRYSSIVANQIKENGQYGINIEPATTYNTNISFFENEAKGNGVLDCNDDSVASGPSGYTLGTHDTWFYDIGNSSHPTGICTPGRGH
jgi:hypothetical protein